MEIFEAIGNLNIVKQDRSKVMQINGFDWFDTCELAIKALQLPQWVYLTEGPPKNGQRVLGYTIREAIETFVYEDGIWYSLDGFKWPSNHIICWMRAFSSSKSI